MQQQQEAIHFIGREDEMQTFKRWLNDPAAPWILYIHDKTEEIEKKGGVGKTSLLRRFVGYVKDERPEIGVVVSDFFNVGDRDRIFLAEKIVAGLQQMYASWYPDAFYNAIAQYRIEVTQLSAGSGSENTATRIREDAAAGLADDLLRLDAYLEHEQKTLLLVFDTYEAIEQNPGIAVLRLAQTFPDNYQIQRVRVILAGRNKLNWAHQNWQGRQQEVKEIALPPFNVQEMREYIDSECSVEVPQNSWQEQALYDRTEGRPIMIGLAVDVLNHHILSLDKLVEVTRPAFEGYLVSQINKLQHPLNWVTLFMAHVYHRFNFSLLEWILQSVKPEEIVSTLDREELLEDLPRLSFVRQPSSGEDFVLHDEMRRLVTKYCWDVQDPTKQMRKEISQSVIKYYEQQITETKSEQQRQEYIIETLYHRLYIDLDDGLRYFQSYFQEAVRLIKSAFARLLFEEVQKFTGTFSQVQSDELRFAEVKLYRVENNSQKALALLQELERSSKEWRTSHKADYLMEAGLNYGVLSNWTEAAECYTACLMLAKEKGQTLREAYLYSNLARVYRRRGQFDDAVRYYNEAIVLFKQLDRRLDFASTLANISAVYRLQGKIEEALRKARVAWRIRLDMFQEGKGSELLVGFSLSILGVIYLSAGNILEAERCFNEAYDIYLRANSKGNIALIYNRFGQVHLLKGELEQAGEWFEKAESVARDIEPEQYINSLNKQGNVCMLQHRWSEARRFFQQAIVQSDRVFDYYQQTESLIDLANIFRHEREEEHMEVTLQRAHEIASKENYYRLLGRIEQMRAEAAYSKQNYAAAFEHFALYCHDMALYNAIELSIAVRSITDALLGVPKAMVPTLVQELLDYWTTHQLNDKYPLLVQALEEVDELIMP